MKIQQQKGLTLIGFIFVLAIALSISFVGMKIVPIYIDNYSVLRTMKEVASEKGAARRTPYQIRIKLFTLLNINAIDHIKESDVKILRSSVMKLSVKYEVREPIFGNLDVVVRFNESVILSD